MIKFSDFDFLLLAFSTKSKTLLTVDSPNSFVTFIFITPFIFIVPLKTSSPFCTSLGILSPVRAFVSKLELPEITYPSNGIFSPGFTTIISPIFTSSGETSHTLSSLKTFATSGLISIRLEIDFLDLSTA